MKTKSNYVLFCMCAVLLLHEVYSITDNLTWFHCLSGIKFKLRDEHLSSELLIIITNQCKVQFQLTH